MPFRMDKQRGPITATLLLLGIAGCSPLGGQSAATTAGELVNPGMVPNNWQMPISAIDTTGIPEIHLDPHADETAPLPVYRLSEDSYFLFGNIGTLDKHNRGWNGNAGFVVTDDGVAVIDTLGTPKLGQRLIATIRSVTDQPIRYLVITHNHPDHAYGAAPFRALPGVTIIAHPGMEAYNNSSTMESSVAYRQEQLGEDMQGFAPVQADDYLDEKMFSQYRFTLGGSTFDVYNTGQHHSHGDLVVHQHDKHIVWISDLAFNQRTTYMGDGHSAAILEAQDWLMSHFTDAQLMVPGHGSPQTAPFPMVSQTRDYVQRLRQTMGQAVEDGVSLYDAVRNTEFEDWKKTRLYEENHRANLSHVYREMELQSFENF